MINMAGNNSNPQAQNSAQWERVASADGESILYQKGMEVHRRVLSSNARMLLGRERNLGSYPSPVHQTKHDQDQTTEILAPPTAAQMKEVDEAFALFDTRKAGTLDLYEVKVLMRSLGFTVRRKEVPLIVHHANPDSDGSVDLQTFRRIMESKFTKLEPGRGLRETFRLFDTAGRGKERVSQRTRSRTAPEQLTSTTAPMTPTMTLTTTPTATPTANPTAPRAPSTPYTLASPILAQSVPPSCHSLPASSGAPRGRPLRQRLELTRVDSGIDNPSLTAPANPGMMTASTGTRISEEPVTRVVTAGSSLVDHPLREITIDDLRRASKDLDGKASERELEAVIDAFDRNLDGAISQEEFMSSIREQRRAGV